MKLSKDNFEFICANLYDLNKLVNSDCFSKDILLFTSLNKHFHRLFLTNDERQMRIILNRLITIFNVFSPPSYVKELVFFKVHKEYHENLKSFLNFLGFYEFDDYSINLLNNLNSI